MSILENNCMQSTASAAGYSTGATIATAFGALLLLQDGADPAAIKTWGVQPVWIVASFTLVTAAMGVFLAIPMKRQMINQEKLPFPSGIAAATTAIVRMLHTPAVVVVTKSGFTARIVSSHRPGVPIVALTDELRTYRQLALVWGVVPVLLEPQATDEAMTRIGLETVQRHGLAKTGDRVVVTAGVPFGAAGTTNLLKVETV
jgi:pyruvate kinase